MYTRYISITKLRAVWWQLLTWNALGHDGQAHPSTHLMENLTKEVMGQAEVVEIVLHLIISMLLLPHMCSWDMIQSKRAM